MLKSISNFDRRMSAPIIHLDSKPATYILYPFAAFFHPKLIWIAYASVYLVSGCVESTLVYLAATLFALICTTILKKITRRARPALIVTA